ncbi:MAG: acyl--CoA ligase [Streptomycetaceae bacterium]|nr:acyl--CoA ligase [Streptomycetaceae bacterium]
MAPHAPAYGNYAHAVLTAQALRAPDRIAVVHRGRQLTYAELNARVNRRAAVLAEVRGSAGDRVGCLLQDPLAITEVYLAAAKVGLPLAALNPYWSDDVLAEVVRRSGCGVFVYDEGCDAVVARIRDRVPEIRVWLRVGSGSPAPNPGDAVDFDAATAAADDREPPVGACDDDLFALFFTSGSTGLPKAVRHTHRSALAIAQLWLDIPTGPDAVFGTGPIIWGVGFAAIAGPALYAGMRLALADDFGPTGFLDAVPHHRVTHISVIPSFFVELLGSDAHMEVDLTLIRVVMLGGEPVLPSVLARIQARLPDATVFSYYGQTEAPYSVVGVPGEAAGRAIGRARTGGAVAVVGPDGERLVDEVGEIRLAGPHVMQGYDGHAERTAEVLRGGWYVGGDLGVMDAGGRLTVLGRRDDALVREGHYILPGDVEDAALALADVAEAGAVVVGSGDDKRLLLAVSPVAGRALDPDTVATALKGRLPAYGHPDTIVVAPELPHSQDASGGKGKLLRREIAARWGDRR